MKKLKLSSPLKSVSSSYKSFQLQWFHDIREIHDAYWTTVKPMILNLVFVQSTYKREIVIPREKSLIRGGEPLVKIIMFIWKKWWTLLRLKFDRILTSLFPQILLFRFL